MRFVAVESSVHDPILRSAQIGRTFKKKRAQPAYSLRLGLRAAAAVLDAHVGDLRRGDGLPGWMARGSTWPEKRSTSTLWFTPICFSPAISRWPLGSTPVTVAVMVPEKSLVFSVLPLPAKVLLEVPAALAPAEGVGRDQRQRGDAGAELAALVDRAGALLAGETFSTICTVSVSPTRRARWSSNSGRYCAGLEDRAVVDHRRGHAARARRGRLRPRRPAAGAFSVWQPASSVAAATRPEQRAGEQQALHHSWPSFCSIWSEVWIAFELSS